MEDKRRVKADLEVWRSSHSITLYWREIVPTDTDEYYGYCIKYMVNTTKKLQTIHIDRVDVDQYTIDDLQSDTEYTIWLYTTVENTEKEFYKTVVKTECSLAKLFFNSCEKLGENPTTYTLKPLDIVPVSKDVRMCYYEKKERGKGNSEVPERIIIVLGETGSGKSTWLDAMFNYVAGVTQKDDFRFQLIHLTDKEAAKHGQQTESQTDGITCYHIPKKSGSVISFRLCVIDSPGFGDSRGKKIDETIPTKINELFRNNIEQLHAICLVVKASTNRLTASQKYVFTKLMELFGKDVKANICALLTYDDGATGRPQVLDLIEKVGIEIADDAYFRFNNSNLFSRESSSDAWKKRNENFMRFFQKLGSINPISLQFTKKVLETREKLSNDLKHVAVAIQTNVNDTLKCKTEKEQLMKFESEMNENKNFELKKMVTKPDTKTKPYTSLNCTFCSKTCHDGCLVIWPYSVFTWTCFVFNNNHCQYCGCHRERHAIQGYTHTTKVLEETETSAEMKKRYEVAEEGAEGHRKMLDKNRDKIKQSLINLDKKIDQAATLIKELEVVALKPVYRTVLDFLKDVEEEQTSEASDERNQDHTLKLEFVKMLSSVRKLRENNKSLTELLDNLS